MPKAISCDVAVIGAGTAGLAAYRAAKKAGVDARLVDRAFAGTTCILTGCMPSKALIAASEAAHAIRTAGVFGLHGHARVDGVEVMHRVRETRAYFLASERVHIDAIPKRDRIVGEARFSSRDTLILDDGTRIHARAIIIATGASPEVPHVLQHLDVHTHETIFELATLPRSLAVIGAGAVGIELAQAFARLGTKVTLFDEGTAIAGMTDPVVLQTIRERIGRELALLLGVRVTEASRVRGGIALGAHGTFEHVLVAAGRPPDVRSLDLHASGLALDEHGVPKFDRHTLRCGDSAVFIAGDVDRDWPVLHDAALQGELAGKNAAAFPDVRPHARATPLAVTFVDPQLVRVGMRYADLPDDHRAATAPFADTGRARLMDRQYGVLRLYADRDKRILGSEMAAPAGEHVGHLLALAIGNDMTVEQLMKMPFYHPTYEEQLRTALRVLA